MQSLKLSDSHVNNETIHTYRNDETKAMRYDEYFDGLCRGHNIISYMLLDWMHQLKVLELKLNRKKICELLICRNIRMPFRLKCNFLLLCIQIFGIKLYRIKFYKCQLEQVTCIFCTKGSQRNVLMVSYLWFYGWQFFVRSMKHIHLSSKGLKMQIWTYFAFCFAHKPAKELYKLSCYILQCNKMGYCFYY